VYKRQPASRSIMVKMNGWLALVQLCNSERGDENIKDIRELISEFKNTERFRTRVDALLGATTIAGNLEVAKLLIENGADVYQSDGQLLRFAVLEGHLEIIKYLNENFKFDLNMNGEILIIKASEKGYLGIVKYLTKNGSWFFPKEKALRKSAKNGHFEIVKYLVEKQKSDIHFENDKPVKNAIKNGHLEIVKYFVQEIGKCDEFGLIDFAFKFGKTEIFKYFIKERGFIVEDSTKLLQETLKNKFSNLEMIKFLIEELKADIHFKKDIALINAIDKDNLELIKFLAEECGTDTIYLDHDEVFTNYFRYLS
jgi:ankyrin repeat protein